MKKNDLVYIATMFGGRDDSAVVADVYRTLEIDKESITIRALSGSPKRFPPEEEDYLLFAPSDGWKEFTHDENIYTIKKIEYTDRKNLTVKLKYRNDGTKE